jgi:NAD(P)H-dependent flavin oxidoreductase YrpB (nitropropane dioxygenase family)
MGTRFLASNESNASIDFKSAIIRAQVNDIVTYMSNAGMPARALLESGALGENIDVK